MDEKALEAVIQKVLAAQGGIAGATTSVAQAPAADEKTGLEFPVELSGKHVHLSEADVKALFGELTYVRELSQPGQYLCKERVRLIGPKGVMDNVAVLGPPRKASQVELSFTDARDLGLKAPVRESGNVAGSPGLVLASDKGLVALEEGAIVAARHIHMTPADAARFGVKDKERVSVQLGGARPAIFQDVIVRVSEDFALAMHIDFDEGNCCGLGRNAVGCIVKG